MPAVDLPKCVIVVVQPVAHQAAGAGHYVSGQTKLVSVDEPSLPKFVDMNALYQWMEAHGYTKTAQGRNPGSYDQQKLVFRRL